MGQQQLLLIVLGVIIVGIAIVVGINLFTASSATANRDAVTSDCVNIGAMAQQYYRKPKALGGGNSSFVGFTTSIGGATSKVLNNANGTYVVSGEAAGSVVITGTGKEKADGTNLVEVATTVYADSMKSTVTH